MNRIILILSLLLATQIDVVSGMKNISPDDHDQHKDKRQRTHSSGCKGNPKNILHAVDACCGYCCEKFLNQGANPNIWEGQSLLSNACESECVEIIKLLLGNGADLNLHNSIGCTSLHCVGFNGNTEILMLLLEAGANFTLQNNKGDTVLHEACREGHEKIVSSLINYIQTKVSNKNFNDILDFFYKSKCQRIFTGLLSIQRFQTETLKVKVPKPLILKIVAFIILADFIGIKNKDNETALDLAKKAGHRQIVQLLTRFC